MGVTFQGESRAQCPSTVRPVFPMLVFQQGKQENHTQITFSAVLGTPPHRHSRTKRFPLEELWGGCLVSWVPKWESTDKRRFHSLEPYTKPYSDTPWKWARATWGCSNALTLTLLQKYRSANGSGIVIQNGGVYTTFQPRGGHAFAKASR